MLKYLSSSLLLLLVTDTPKKTYSWLEKTDNLNTIETRIKVPDGFTRMPLTNNSFAYWLRHLPLKPANTPVKTWDGELKYDQNMHCAVVDLDFIGGNLQQCIDAIIRLRAEYLLSANREDEIQFSYSCCTEKIAWKKWKNGWRTKIINTNGKSSFEWVKTQKADSSLKNFRSYLHNVMNYAGTLSLSRDMKKTEVSQLLTGDAFVHGAAPGAGHGVLIVDMAVSASGKKLMLLGQSFNPAENFNIIKSSGKYSPWFEMDFGEELKIPQWYFSKGHARKFE
ncbi:MAG: hypothetical protein IAF38_22335 [Bacteroidia bacterium]|nr:hypothetical protein [Bacteroidia bacterium]